MGENNTAPALVSGCGTGVAAGPRDAPRQQSQACMAQATERQVNILLVDDEPANILALRAVLSDLGHNLVEARSGEEALRRLLADDFALVLLDVHMGGLDGFETARLLRSRDKCRHLPLIFLTAHDTDHPVVHKAYALGAVDFLVKPLVPFILKAKVAALVELFQKTQQVQRQADALRRRERQLAEEGLRESEERFRSAFEHTNVAMTLTDMSNRFVRVNAAFVRLFGYTRDEMLRMSMMSITHPDDLAESYLRREDLLADKATSFQIEKRYLHKDGHVLWGLTNVSLIRDGQGRPVQYFGHVQDITERKRAEEAVRQYTNQLVEANRELAEKNQENELFVYSVSHDLRSPLLNLQGFSKELDLVREQLGDLLTQHEVPDAVRDRAAALLESMAESTHFIRTSVTRLSGIIDALLRLSRAGRVEYQWQRIDLNSLLARVVDCLRITAAERGATIRIGALPPVWADPTAVEQIFANLIGNALKYLDPNRPGLVEVGAVQAVSGARPDELQTFYVRDNGLGIPKAYQQKIFQPFQRCHPEAAKGEGLGLTIVQRIATRHHGKVWVESDAGAGATFFITLPTTANVAN